jgi:hypothetical protein
MPVSKVPSPRGPLERAVELVKLTALGAAEMVLGIAFYVTSGVVVGDLLGWADGRGLSTFDLRVVSIMQIASGVAFLIHGAFHVVIGLRLAYLTAKADWKGESE